MNDFTTIDFEEISEDGLSSTHWSFFLIYGKFVLNSYAKLDRDSKRKKFTRTHFWYRLSGNRGNIEKSAVPYTKEIEKRAREILMEMISKVDFEQTVD